MTRSAVRAAFALALLFHATLTAPATAECWTISGYRLLSSDATYECVTIEQNSTLEINAGVTLNITGEGGLTLVGSNSRLYVNGKVDVAGGGTHSITGLIFLTSGSAVLAIEDQSSTLKGTGTIFGQHRYAAIRIERGTTLASNLTIQGGLNFQPTGSGGTANLVNDGIIRADASSITINPGVCATDCAGARWEATGGTSGHLVFNAASNLVGTIGVYEYGRLELNVSGGTQGDLDYTVGAIDLGWSVCFSAGSDTCGLLEFPLVGLATVPLVCP